MSDEPSERSDRCDPSASEEPAIVPGGSEGAAEDEADLSSNPTPSHGERDEGLDIDARFAEIIARWEPSPLVEGALDDEAEGETEPEGPSSARAPADSPTDSLKRLFRPAWSYESNPETQGAATTSTPDPDDHFTPPEPPPLPAIAPHRRWAWKALIGCPLAGFLLVVVGFDSPRWLIAGLVMGFVAGFGYLIATMDEDRDTWPGDDGARV